MPSLWQTDVTTGDDRRRTVLQHRLPQRTEVKAVPNPLLKERQELAFTHSAPGHANHQSVESSTLGLSRDATRLHVGLGPLTNGIRAADFRGLTRVTSHSMPAIQQRNTRQQRVDVRYWHKADMRQRSIDVRFTPESTHSAAQNKCPLRTKSGHARDVERPAPRRGLSEKISRLHYAAMAQQLSLPAPAEQA